jgi:hypothetical protein
METEDEKIEAIEGALDFCELLIEELAIKIRDMMNIESKVSENELHIDIAKLNKAGFFKSVADLNQKLTVLKDAQDHLVEYHDDLLDFYNGSDDGGISAELHKML